MMNRKAKRLDKLLDGRSDHNLQFDDLLSALEYVGFVYQRQEGSHRIFTHPDLPDDIVNVQPAKDGKAKPYQVKQIRVLIQSLPKPAQEKENPSHGQKN